jgi:molybdenum cofactor cytidylyltransferase
MEANPKSKIKLNITGLLLCAGLSGRMGTSKALMIYNGLPFAVVIIKKLLLVCKEVLVVIGYESERVETEIKNYLKADEVSNVKFVLNENYKDGMFSSMQCGLKQTSKANWILYHFVDQPSLPVLFYNQFIEKLSEGINWVQPSHNNNLGHPILFNRKVVDIILHLSENNSLRDLSNDHGITKQIWNCNYPEILQDIDTIDEFINLISPDFQVGS